METEEASQSAEESNNEPTPVPARKQKGNNAKGKKADKKLAPETAPPTFDSKKPESTQVSSKKAPGKAGKKHIRFDDNEEPEEQPAEKPVPVIINKAGHTRFGAAEPAQPAEEPAPSHTVGESEASDSDDEAPETVTAASALSTAKAAQVEAARAREAAEAKEKQKKKERADRIAEEQRLKKKKEAKKLEKQQAREAQQAKPEADAEDADAMDLDIHNLPALLPTSLLEAAPERRPPTPPLTFFTGPSAADLKQEKLNRHIKFLEHGEKPVKDVRKGPVNVHVLGSQNKFLAPKVNRDTRNVREQWLKGRQVQKVDRKGRKKLTGARVERRAVTGGFLRGDD
ncbi:hypothetical protein GQ43DRAFT_438082 [Delitschia confertaspora ATCC 74209]|uniref:Uncharacterized protein n=1 Tax=Delitschia confertaspora ATCC 74209 TaxID=1513339 RepID=A0A9P4JSC1_9PLEO|nr:hypothetical protein GQ43DRAFT_438082 [Delitschia confertaspora ATCC 74209]